jgi:NAD(P)-dependent dehydrogenase (short-subunit alcohol dehydrogenase family)
MVVQAGTLGPLRIAVNNAGIGGASAVLGDYPVDSWHRVIDVNLNAVFLGMRAQLPALVANGGGAIVNMASVAGVRATTNLAAYVAGKAGIIGLTKVAALDYADRGVRVNVVAPGPILTHHLQAAGQEAQRLAGVSTPMRRTGTVDEVARTVLWLCSPAASFITGAVVPIDGGQSAGTKPERMYRQGKGMSS